MKCAVSTKFKSRMYAGFSGITTARSEISMERPEEQPLLSMDNMYCSSKGYMTNEPSLVALNSDDGFVSHIRGYDTINDVLVYAIRDGSSTSLHGVNSNAKMEEAWSVGASVCSTYFNRNIILCAGEDAMVQFDGASFTKIESKDIVGARYICQASNRLIAAGFDRNPYEIKLSRVDDPSAFAIDENVENAAVTKGARLNIQNVAGSGERIRGMAVFESKKLAIFTGDMMMVYVTDPDYTQWVIEPLSTIRHGTISHKSIVSVGGDLFFCSLSGIHSVRRSVTNGATVFASAMSEDITELYQVLLSSVKNHEDISGVYDPVTGRIHFFFPVHSRFTYRLSGSLADARTEQETTKVRWSLTTHGGMTCGAYQSGTLYAGTISGVKAVSPWFKNDDNRGAAYATLPTLWHDNIINPKRSLHMVLYASGYGEVRIRARDETNRELGVVTFELPKSDQIDYSGVPLQRQFIRPFEHEYVGLRLSIEMAHGSVIRIFSIGVNTKE